MNNDNNLIPLYRFPEFKDDGNWNLSPLSDKIDYERPDKYIVKNTNYLNKGIPVLTANKSFVLGYTDENEGVYRDNLPVIIFDDFTVDNKYVDFPFKVKSSAIKILKNKNEKDSLKFFYELMSQIKFEAKEHKRYYISAYQKIEVPVPLNPAEQKKIAACLSSLDNVIAGHEEKLTALEEHKKGLMQNLFPQEGETQPKFRFLEFENDGDWMEKKLGDVAILTSSKRVHLADYVPEGIPFFRGKEITELKYNTTPKDLLYISKEQYEIIKSKYGIPSIGDILITAVGTLGNTLLIDKEFKFYFKDGNLIWLKNITEDSSFLDLLLIVRKDKVLESAIGSSQKALTMEALRKLEFLFPPTQSEQQKIAAILSSVDELIIAQREKIEALKEHKKGLMQGLFPKIES